MRIRSENEIDRSCRVLRIARHAINAVVYVFVRLRRLPLGTHVEKVDEEIVGQRLGTIGEHAVTGIAEVRVQRAKSADQHCHLGRGQRQHVRAVDQQNLCRNLLASLEVVPESVGPGFEYLERVDVCLLLRCIRSARRERDRDVLSGVLRSLFDGRCTTQNDQVGERNLCSTSLVEVLLNTLESLKHRGESCRLVDFPILLRLQSDSRTVGAAAHVRAAEARGRRPRRRYQLRNGQPGVEKSTLEDRDVCVPDQLIIGRGNRVLPQLRLGNPRSQVARDRSHVTVKELVPSLGELFGEFFRMIEPAPGDLLVRRIQA